MDARAPPADRKSRHAIRIPQYSGVYLAICCSHCHTVICPIILAITLAVSVPLLPSEHDAFKHAQRGTD